MGHGFDGGILTFEVMNSAWHERKHLEAHGASSISLACLQGFLAIFFYQSLAYEGANT